MNLKSEKRVSWLIVDAVYYPLGGAAAVFHLICFAALTDRSSDTHRSLWKVFTFEFKT